MKNIRVFIEFHKKASNLIYSLVILISSLVFTWTIGYLKPNIFTSYPARYFFLTFVLLFYFLWLLYSIILSKVLSINLETTGYWQNEFEQPKSA